MASQNLEPLQLREVKDQIDGKSPLLGALFLFFLVFFTFLFVYYLYVRARRHHFGGPVPDNSNAPPAHPRPAVAGLDSATISGLPMFAYGSSNDSSPEAAAECAICLSMFSEGDKVKVLPFCHHGFHSVCVDKWLRSRSNCPLCRACIHRMDSTNQLEIS
ncbi:RING-H2 finger protein ATL64-like [Henckelia pumila]|uniref:RING-H2 finger protein ATL64-like n=1 Tax=Henckelia pumila TaxID=405737 RepID=UPI003C6E3D14